MSRKKIFDPSDCPCGFQTRLNPRTAAYHRAHRVNHLEAYPYSDGITRRSLDQMVAMFETKEAREAS